VVAGSPSSEKFRGLLHAAHSVYQPNKVLSGNTGPVEEFSRTLPARGEAVVYLCRGTACDAPVADPAALVAALLPNA